MNARDGLGRAVSRATSVAGSLRRNGLQDSVRRVVRRAYGAVGAAELDFPLLPADIADSLDGPGRPRPELPLKERATVSWVCTPPSAGSGGHTTLFRMVEALERLGHDSVIHLYDRHNGDPEERAAVIRRSWPQLRSRIADVRDGFDGVDAVVASSWQTAHVVASRTRDLPVRRLYLIQDYEPYFYPRGSLYALAEDSYRFGFTDIALGHMVETELRTQLGIEPEVVEFGCDTDVYRLTNRGERRGIVFYGRPSTDRRGFELARLALARFHERHPEQPIHVYGDAPADWPFPVVAHGKLTPAALNELYNTAIAGLAMSFTNISLVAEELLAAGAMPVVNDSPLARADLPNPEASWAVPTAQGLADALSAAVTSFTPERATRAAAGTRHGWEATAQRVAHLAVDGIAPFDARTGQPGATPVARTVEAA